MGLLLWGTTRGVLLNLEGLQVEGLKRQHELSVRMSLSITHHLGVHSQQGLWRRVLVVRVEVLQLGVSVG